MKKKKRITSKVQTPNKKCDNDRKEPKNFMKNEILNRQ